jgi:hypothetical protein
MSGAVLAGQPVDLDRLAAAHSLLQKMLPGGSLIAPAPAPETSSLRFGQSYRERLRRLIEQTVFAPAAEAERLADACAREEQVAADEAAGVAPAPPEERRKPLSESAGRHSGDVPRAARAVERPATARRGAPEGGQRDAACCERACAAWAGPCAARAQ